MNGSDIKAAMDELGLTTAQLARLIDPPMDRRQLADTIRGNRTVRTSRARDIREALARAYLTVRPAPTVSPAPWRNEHEMCHYIPELIEALKAVIADNDALQERRAWDRARKLLARIHGARQE